MAGGAISLNAHEKEYATVVDKLCGSRQRWQVWQDLITIFACSINMAVDRNPDRLKRRKNELDQATANIKDMELAVKAFNAVINALERNPDQDFLGSLYMKLELGSHWHGQFFTPYSVSKMTARCTLDGIKKIIEEKGWASALDPAIGGGAMPIALANAAREQRINYQDAILFVGQDIDPIVGKMAYIQLSLLGCAGYIVIANALTDPIVGDVLMPTEKEGQDFWYTTFYFKDTWDCRRRMKTLDQALRQFETIEKKRERKPVHDTEGLAGKESVKKELKEIATFTDEAGQICFDLSMMKGIEQ